MNILKCRACLLGYALAAACTHAQGAQLDCVSFYYPPMILGRPGGMAKGLAVDIVGQALRGRGHQVRTRLYPWGRALAMSKAGQADCIFTLYFSKERAAFLEYSRIPLETQTIYLYARAGVELAINDNVDLLAYYRIGTARNVLYGPRFESVRAQLHIDEASTIAQSFIKLALGRVDLVPSSGATAEAILAQPAMAPFARQIVRLPVPIDTVKSFVGFSRKGKFKGLRDQFDEGMRELIASGDHARPPGAHNACFMQPPLPCAQYWSPRRPRSESP